MPGTVPPELLERTGMGQREIRLLQACLLDGDAGRQAVQDFLPELGEPDGQDWSSFKQMPLLYRNLGRLGIDDPWGGRMRGVRQFFWARTCQRLGAAEQAIARLNAAGVPAMLLKGAAMVASGQVEAALRPMDDVDVLVPIGQVGAALRAMAADGWTAKLPQERAVIADAMATDRYDGRCVALGRVFGGASIELDLHQFTSHFDLRAGTDDGIWARSSEGRLGRTPVRLPCVEDQLVLICTHAASKTRGEEDSAPTLRWVADLACLVDQPGARIDWDLIVQEARRRHASVMLHDAFALLAELLGPRMPAPVLHRLWQGRRLFEAGCARALRVPDDERGLAERMHIRLDRYRRMRPDLFDSPTPQLLVKAAGWYMAKLARPAS